jgi:CubicO group peptidase (beta-lactamase class C family)
MRIIAAILFSIVMTQSVFSQNTVAFKSDELLKAYGNLGKFNGTVLIAWHGKVILEKGYGFKDFRDSALNDPNTVYQIASVTKQFTSTVILKLAELKELSLADKLSKYYPDLPKADSISIEDLLSHTSGIADHYNDTSLQPSSRIDEKRLLASIKKYDLAFTPGTDWQYSNKGYQLLGYIIQKVTKMTYYDAVNRYIFTPLKMNSSGFDFIHLTSGEKATGYWSVPRDTAAESATIIDSSAAFAAGSIFSTVGDLYKWHEGLQQYKIVNKASLESAYTPRRNNYGHGWMIDSLFNERIIHHSGDIWGFKSDIERVTEDDACIVLLNNIEDPDLGVISKKLFAILYHQPYKLPAKNEIRLSDEILKKYIGTYEIRPGLLAELTLEDGHLMATTDHKEELYAQKENHFIADSGGNQAKIEFEVDQTGKVSKLVLCVNGQSIACQKIK